MSPKSWTGELGARQTPSARGRDLWTTRGSLIPRLAAREPPTRATRTQQRHQSAELATSPPRRALSLLAAQDKQQAPPTLRAGSLDRWNARRAPSSPAVQWRPAGSGQKAEGRQVGGRVERASNGGSARVGLDAGAKEGARAEAKGGAKRGAHGGAKGSRFRQLR